LRMWGSIETSWIVVLGALFCFVMFGGIWLLMLLELVASWLSIPFDVMAEDLGPITFGDFVATTFLASVMVFMTGNMLYGRFFMSQEKADAMFQHWKDRRAILLVTGSSGPYSVKAFRFILQLAGWVSLIMILTLPLIFFAE
ncbi:MAG: hypothetical protein P8N68_18280, partial [Paracoccaceae bacterium]|nr:hypothetical protein [Paracoccaceae bacterium]